MELCLFLLALLICCCMTFLSSASVSALELAILNGADERTMPTAELVTYYGYRAETHTVHTPDGVKLFVHRIPCGRSGCAAPAAGSRSPPKPRPAVLLQHGLMDASSTFVINFPSGSLGFLLADAGFDVWLGNNRGNTYSEVPDTNVGWDFTFDEMAQFDVPAMLGYIRNVTGLPSVGVVGHSQGTSQMFAALARHGQPLQSQVNLFVALAPVTFVQHQSSPIFGALCRFDTGEILHFLGCRKFFTNNEFFRVITKFLCHPKDILSPLCTDAIFLLCGKDTDKGANFNSSRMDVYSGSHTPAGTSVKNMVHWAQLIRSGHFRLFDHGSADNKRRYGSEQPPDYDLGAIRVPTMLVTGGLDALANPTDVKRLIAALPPTTIVDHLNIPQYDHIDFTWGLNAPQLVYPRVIQLLQKYAPQGA